MVMDTGRASRCVCYALVACLTMLAGCGDDGDDASTRPDTPALIVDRSHDVARTTDFLRIIYVPASVEVTTLGAPSAVRAFVGASAYFTPALALIEVAAFLGVPDAAELDFVAMRCQPHDVAALDARFATWPHVFEIIRNDLGGQYVCPPPAGAPPENAVYCLAAAYADESATVVARPLATALEFGAELLENSAAADVVRRRYGIYPGFSGLGLSVLGSASSQPLNAADTLQAAIAPEYLVRNATLADGGCRCIRVAPYANRAMDPLDPRFISEQGDLGRCRAVPKLRFAS